MPGMLGLHLRPCSAWPRSASISSRPRGCHSTADQSPPVCSPASLSSALEPCIVVPGDSDLVTGILSKGRSNVLIKNGTVDNFMTGIRIQNADRKAKSTTRIDSVTVTQGWTVGIEVLSSTRVSIANSSLPSNETAMSFQSTSQSAVYNTTFSLNQAAFYLTGGDGNRLRRNKVTDNYDGFIVDDATTNTLIELNTFESNSADGLRVDSPSATLIDNTANDNGDLGIRAVAGVTDGGGNTATGNGDPAQCTGVVCS
jgi:parallel beta-helix repeat protein